MTKLIVDFEHCYGINKLQHMFQFEDEHKVNLIYAPNGVMKTSFAKTFNDYSLGKPSFDRVYDRPAKRKISNENKDEFSKESIFVINSYDEEYSSVDRASTLLVNKELKKKHDDICSELEKLKGSLFNGLKNDYKHREPLEREILSRFKGDDLYEVLLSLKCEVENFKKNYTGITYGTIFNNASVAILRKDEVMNSLSRYIQQYDAIIEKSNYFRENFDHFSAQAILKSLKDNNYFNAKHLLKLNQGDGSGTVDIQTDLELKDIIKEEINKVYESPEMKKVWDKLDKELSKNKDSRLLRDTLNKRKDLIPMLADRNKLAQDMIISLLAKNKEIFGQLVNKYSEVKNSISEISIQAKNEKSHWENVIDIFNKRFSVPFLLNIENREDVVLKEAIPKLSFEFQEGKLTQNLKKETLVEILSTGEKRALYILNILFEVEMRRQRGDETLFVIDDLADSFDYKNKYAIIKYLAEMALEPNFKLIILTHNFDFFRTVRSRMYLKRRFCHKAVKRNGHIKIKEKKYQNNPFDHWKNNLNNKLFLIACIPFVRNLIEYMKSNNDQSYLKLTSVLHIKNDSKNIKIKDIENIFQEAIHLNKPFKNREDSILELIYSESEDLAGREKELELEGKIVLSIGIRLIAEEYMITKINDPDFVSKIENNQTMELFLKYKNLFGECENLNLLDEVNLITPENIHLNSFMFEPILDMGESHLKKLYLDLRQIL